MTKAADKILADYQAYTKIKPKRKIENIKYKSYYIFVGEFKKIFC